MRTEHYVYNLGLHQNLFQGKKAVLRNCGIARVSSHMTFYELWISSGY